MKTRILLLSAALLGLGLPAAARVTLPSFFSDNMVLQQQCNAAVWGSTDRGRTVVISPSWTKKKFKAKPDADGKWQTTVPTPAAGGPYTISFSDGDKTVLHNVLIGEVWFCSGQSNMEMPVRGFHGSP